MYGLEATNITLHQPLTRWACRMYECFSEVTLNFDLRSNIAIWSCKQARHACRPSNDFQLGGTRAAQHICALCTTHRPPDAMLWLANSATADSLSFQATSDHTRCGQYHSRRDCDCAIHEKEVKRQKNLTSELHSEQKWDSCRLRRSSHWPRRNALVLVPSLHQRSGRQ